MLFTNPARAARNASRSASSAGRPVAVSMASAASSIWRIASILSPSRISLRAALAAHGNTASAACIACSVGVFIVLFAGLLVSLGLLLSKSASLLASVGRPLSRSANAGQAMLRQLLDVH